jgi:hypothetical protein
MGLALPGTTVVASGPVLDSSQADQYQEQFNASRIVASWGATPFSGIPVIGDIFAGFNFMWQNVQYILNGLPMFLQYLSNTYITDIAAYNSFIIITYALEAIYAFLMVWFLIEFISGRILD